MLCGDGLLLDRRLRLLLVAVLRFLFLPLFSLSVSVVTMLLARGRWLLAATVDVHQTPGGVEQLSSAHRLVDAQTSKSHHGHHHTGSVGGVHLRRTVVWPKRNDATGDRRKTIASWRDQRVARHHASGCRSLRVHRHVLELNQGAGWVVLRLLFGWQVLKVCIVRSEVSPGKVGHHRNAVDVLICVHEVIGVGQIIAIGPHSWRCSI
mmetsp:Transcript_40158/g.101103  ORF Transcript_40158/g.101103 Transcript_40158/m.101103 type:complete len:207 (-) Transcript_40158:1134-1754(-)